MRKIASSIATRERFGSRGTQWIADAARSRQRVPTPAGRGGIYANVP